MTTKQNRPGWGQQQGGNAGNTRRCNRNINAGSGQPVYRADGRAVIGRTDGNTFTKYANGSKHMLQRPKGWASDVAVLNEVRARGVTTFKVIDRETGITYTARLADFDRFGVALQRQFGPQVCLPLCYWTIDGAPPSASALRPTADDDPPAAPGTQNPTVRQLGLW
jgi:hypothetical protein